MISNAYKYTPAGGKVSLTVEDFEHEEPDWIYIRTTIEDTGIGMDKEFLPHLFDEFSREHTQTENKVTGTGLGMAIVKRLIDLMRGTIEVTSEPNKGTKFVITLPHRVAEITEVTPTETSTEAVTTTEETPWHLLLVEDNELNAEIATELLMSLGMKVHREPDGQAAIEHYAAMPAGTYDAILMDIQMPRMDGYEATRYIRAMEDASLANIPIIAMTANAFLEDRQAAADAGMNDHVAKPVDITQLVNTLSKHIK